ncbi:acetyltransferase [Vibrio chagasii]|uniref:acetyltransferase n=1 Tax=Vibrio chagasii TaxID=170679 RepID=UPI0022847ADC|nr:acetyltransferase [Vibrio chagasii]MCY9826426.1 acetyltransferase [Vibrio chagasii]
MSNQKPLVIIGAGGHASVLLDILKQQKRKVIAYISPKVALNKSHFEGIKHLRKDEDISQFTPENIELINGIGYMPKSQLRAKIYQKFNDLGYNFSGVIAESAIISSYATVAPSAQVLAGVIVQVGSVIGANSLINTGTIIEHDTTIESNVHLAPKTLVCGNSRIGRASFVGAGATIINNISVGEQCIVAAGSCIVKNVPSQTLSRG